MKKVVCDKCGREATDRLSNEFNEVEINISDDTIAAFTKDLCSSCTRRLREWLNSPDPEAA